MSKAEDFVKSLKNNAVFQMSLASKELFHSNFLAWLAEDDNTRPAFNYVLRNCFGFPQDYNPMKMEVLREFKNFDFCICEKVKNANYGMEGHAGEGKYVHGPILFVLENKFKSIPDSNQLQRYKNEVDNHQPGGWSNRFKILSEEEKTQRYNEAIERAEVIQQIGRRQKKKHWLPSNNMPSNWKTIFEEEIKKAQDETKYVLLTLVEPSFEPWPFVLYKDYIDRLEDYLKTENTLTRFDHSVITHYIAFVRTLCSYIDTCGRDIQSEDGWDILFKHHELIDIRCNDIWQKRVMSKSAQELKEKLVSLFRQEGQEITVYINTKENDIEVTDDSPTFFIGVGFTHGEGLVQVCYKVLKNCSFVLQQQGDHHLSVAVVGEDSKNKLGALQETFAGQLEKNSHSYGENFHYFRFDQKLNIQQTTTEMAKLMHDFYSLRSEFKNYDSKK